MKLKCDDGIVRTFDVSKKSESAFIDGHEYTETICSECGKNFGVHDSKAIKHLLKVHICHKGG